MSRCTCSTDKEVTCIVHPTYRSLKDRIQKLENRVEKWKKYWDESDRRGDSLEAQLAAERDKVRMLREAADLMYKAYMEGGPCAIIGAVHNLDEVLQATAPEHKEKK